MKACITTIGMTVLMVLMMVCGTHFLEALITDLGIIGFLITGGILTLVGAGVFAEALVAAGAAGGNKKGGCRVKRNMKYKYAV